MQIKAAVVGTGSMGANHLCVLTGFDKEQLQVVGIAIGDGMRLVSIGNAIVRIAQHSSKTRRV